MISGASEEELELANARANVVMKLDNTSTYESWLIIDTYLEQLEKENQKLKKQLENSIKLNIADHKYASECEDKVVTLEAHQKKFIKWLEDKIERLPGLTTVFYRNAKGNLIGHTKIVQGAYKDVLQKYKEIINGDDK